MGSADTPPHRRATRPSHSRWPDRFADRLLYRPDPREGLEKAVLPLIHHSRRRDPDRDLLGIMASSEVDQKFLGQFAENIAGDHPILSSWLFKVLGLSVVLSKQLVRARKLRKLDPTRATKSLDLYMHIIWLSREGLAIIEHFVLPWVRSFSELKVLAYKLRASFYHVFVLFHNYPSVNQATKPKRTGTPPGFQSPKSGRIDKGKVPDRSTPDSQAGRSSVQPSHPMEGGPVGGQDLPPPAAGFLLPAVDYIPTAMACFVEAADLSERLLWGSHPLRLSVQLEFCAFLFDCVHDGDGARRLAKRAIAEVYNAQEGMDDEMFEDAAELVGVLGRMMRRGTKNPNSLARLSEGYNTVNERLVEGMEGGPGLSMNSPI